VSTVYGLVSLVPSGLRTSKRALFDPACAITDICLCDLPKLKTPHRPLPDRPFFRAANEGIVKIERGRALSHRFSL
jgi:hypothetical protein